MFRRLMQILMPQNCLFYASGRAGFTRILVLSTLLVLGGCASRDLDQEVLAKAQLNAAPADATEAEEDAVKPPNMALTAELLEQLLLVSFGPYSGDFEGSAQHALQAAKISGDYRLTSFAAVSALRIRKFDLAREAAELWLQQVPEAKPARTTLILAQLGLGNAEQAYEQLKLRDAELPLIDQAERSAQILAGQRDAQVAVEVAEMYVDDNPDSADVLLSAAYVADSFQQDEKAQLWLTQTLQLKPDWDRAAQLQATVLRRQGKTQERAEFIKSFLSRNPKSVSMRINHAAELAREEDFAAAFALMQEVVSDDPRNVSALSYTAALAEHLQEDEQAKKYYRRVIRLEPHNDEVYWSLARFALREKKYQRAEAYYREISGDQLYFRAQLQVANMRYHTRGLKDAIRILRDLEPRTEQEYIDRATTRHYLLMQERQYEEAFAAINETLIYLPDNIDLRYARALVAAEIKELETAEADLRFIIAAQPKNADALNALGYTLADQTDRYEEAKELISQALEIDSESAHILDSMGWVLYRLQDLEGAVTYLRQAFEKSPQAEVAAHLGEVLWEQGEVEEAREVWSKGLGDDKDNPVLLATLKKYGVDGSLQVAGNGVSQPIN